MHRTIDLTITLSHGMRGVEFEPKYTIDRDGWNARTLHLYSHCGTHMDAPLHFGEASGTIDQIPLDQCMGPAWIVDLPDIQPKASITVADLGAVAERFSPGESLVLRTGWSRHLHQPDFYRSQLPRVSEALADWCVEKQVRMLGVEPPSVADVDDLAEVTLIHKILLGGGVIIVEGLANLEAIHSPKVYLVALPLKIDHGDGAPCRAFAVEGPDWFLEKP